MRWILYVIFFCFVILRSFSQDRPNLNQFVTLTVQDGLSNNSIMAIEKDDQGYLWIGTRNGLNRFDGEFFKIFNDLDKGMGALSHKEIRSLLYDKDGYVWIGTREGINRYTYKTGKIDTIFVRDTGKPIIHAVHSISRMDNGDIWFGSSNRICVYDKNTEQLYKIETSDNNPNFFKESVIQKIFKNADNDIWIGANTGLFQIISVKDRIINLKKMTIKHEELTNISVLDIVENNEGSIYIATENEGLLVFNKSTGFLERFESEQLPTVDIRDLDIDTEGNLWIASYEGLYKLSTDGGIVRINYPGAYFDRVGMGIKTVYSDPAGFIWFGGYSNGLNSWEINENPFRLLNNLRPQIDMDLGVVNSFIKDSLGRMYFGTKKNGIGVVRADLGIEQELTEQLSEKLRGVTVKSFAFFKKFLWIATVEKGVLIYDQIRGKLVDHVLPKELVSMIQKAGRIYSIAQTGTVLVFGTLSGGLIIYDTKTQKIVHHKKNGNVGGQRLGNIRVVYFDSNQNLWIGTTAGLLTCPKGKILSSHNVLERFELSVTDEILKTPEILSITESSQGDLYIGTSEHGFFILNENNQINNFRPLIRNITRNSIISIVEDAKNQIWLSSEQGILQYNPKNDNLRLFFGNDGEIDVEFRNQSGLLGPDGNIYFGSSQGVLYFDPEKVTIANQSKPVTITDFEINLQNDRGSVNKESRLEAFSEKEEIELAHDEKSFTISFSSLDYSKIRSNSYEYRLLGLHDDWKTTGAPHVNYVLQKPGNYVFQVRNEGYLGFDKRPVSSIPIRLQVAPWKSNYAIAGYLFLFLTSLFWIYRILKSKTELKHQLELENLQKLQEKEKYESQLEFFTNLSHDIRTPLSLILAPLHQVLETYSGKKSVYDKLLTVKRNAGQLLHLTNQLLDFKKMEADRSHLRIAKTNIVRVVEDVYTSFKELAEKGKRNYRLHSSDRNIELYCDIPKMERVLYNLISNAFKNTTQGDTITIRINDDPQHVYIEIQDTGIGIAEEKLHKIFARFFKSDHMSGQNNVFAPSIGIGLHIVKKIVEQHRGTILVDSKAGVETNFTIGFQKGYSHLAETGVVLSADSEDPIKSDFQPLLTTHKETNAPYTSLTPKENQPTVLVVEDNPELRKFLIDILGTSYNMIEANDGKEGFKKAVKYDVDLIISDVLMPGIDGIKFCERIKTDRRTNTIPFVMLTSQSFSSQRIKGFKVGADAYITKPFEIEEFLLHIKNMLDRSIKINQQQHKSDVHDPTKTEFVDEDEHLYKKAMDIIHENLSNSDFDMESFVNELGISRSQLFRKIKNWTGQTPKDFIQSIRLKKAAGLLEISSMTISEISYEVGFANPKYFATCFKKEFSQTPTEYAKNFFVD